MTGGRLRRVREYLDPHEPFCFTYGDGLSDVDLTRLLAFHREQGRRVTLTAVLPPGRFGVLDCAGTMVRRFHEKPQGDGARINGGFFVCNPDVIDLIPDDSTVWERGPLESLAVAGDLAAYAHDGFWQPMDTLRDRQLLEELWVGGQAPWRSW
jgi:glucose-1-phosphate cytidylyltransferase